MTQRKATYSERFGEQQETGRKKSVSFNLSSSLIEEKAEAEAEAEANNDNSDVVYETILNSQMDKYIDTFLSSHQNNSDDLCFPLAQPIESPINSEYDAMHDVIKQSIHLIHIDTIPPVYIATEFLLRSEKLMKIMITVTKESKQNREVYNGPYRVLLSLPHENIPHRIWNMINDIHWKTLIINTDLDNLLYIMDKYGLQTAISPPESLCVNSIFPKLDRSNYNYICICSKLAHVMKNTGSAIDNFPKHSTDVQKGIILSLCGKLHI